MKKKAHFFSGGSIVAQRTTMFPVGHNIRFMFSFSLANPDYTGECVRIKRGSDDLEVDIPYVNGVIDEDAIIGKVKAWGNQII